MRDLSHNGSGAEANAPRLRPTMASHRLDLTSICDICGKARSMRTHRTCSRIRQQRKAEEWTALMEERLAARAVRGKRYTR